MADSQPGRRIVRVIRPVAGIPICEHFVRASLENISKHYQVLFSVSVDDFKNFSPDHPFARFVPAHSEFLRQFKQLVDTIRKESVRETSWSLTLRSRSDVIKSLCQPSAERLNECKRCKNIVSALLFTEWYTVSKEGTVKLVSTNTVENLAQLGSMYSKLQADAASERNYAYMHLMDVTTQTTRAIALTVRPELLVTLVLLRLLDVPPPPANLTGNRLTAPTSSPRSHDIWTVDRYVHNLSSILEAREQAQRDIDDRRKAPESLTEEFSERLKFRDSQGSECDSDFVLIPGV
jgi:hypothetical protein